MASTDKMLQKMIAIAHSKPQLPLFHDTHLTTFRSIQNGQPTTTAFK